MKRKGGVKGELGKRKEEKVGKVEKKGVIFPLLIQMREI